MEKIDERCKKFIENLLSEEELKEVEFWGWKHNLVVRDIDVFHNIAQKLGKKTLSLGSSYFYRIRIPRKPDAHQLDSDPWDITLAPLLDDDFLKKYKGQYEIHEI